MTYRPCSKPAAAVRHVFLLVTSAFILLPFVWMVSLSMKPASEIFQSSFSLLPTHWGAVDNYSAALSSAPLLTYMVNGVIVCFSIVVLQIVISAPAAYALAKLDFMGRDFLFGLVLISLLIPHQVLALPLFIIAYKVGLLDSYFGLILPFIVSPFAIFLLRQCFKSVPEDVIHAARLDGLSDLSIIWRILLPMASPAVAALSILTIVSRWNDLFWPSIAVSSEQLMPPPLGMMAFANVEAGTDYGPLMAAAVIIVSPLILTFLIAQRAFVRGLTDGAIK
ncbi:carbohydrate ABC transporter permease [Mesorhizobium sp. WSM3224]|uniref:carbohydrate ABC transporter permease n=1 Tax=Mesorhizobium sp. WSM3224 TaxID=1040986 RepID=UPI0004815C5F|nr:carbohydrate ABC transporter permease [Mesorhizobium sp. WSM3224]